MIALGKLTNWNECNNHKMIAMDFVKKNFLYRE